MLLQNRGGELADVDLYYDFPNGRNLNIIKVWGDFYVCIVGLRSPRFYSSVCILKLNKIVTRRRKRALGQREEQRCARVWLRSLPAGFASSLLSQIGSTHIPRHHQYLTSHTTPMLGSTYYYYPTKEECSVINFPIGILRPDWLKGAAYKGEEEVNGHKVSE